jgi:hypothetical protein
MSAPNGPPATGGMPPPGGAPAGFPPGFDMSLLPHENRGPSIRAAIWPLTGLATLFLGVRLYCRLSKSRRLQLDDYVLLASWVSPANDGVT